MTPRARGLAALLCVAAAACAPLPSSTAAPGDARTLDPTSLARPTPSLGAAATPSAAPATPAATAAATRGPTPTPASAIVPGSVDRASLAVSATYVVVAAISVDSGVFDVSAVIRARNDSGDGIDRLELNTIAARLGDIDITTATVDDLPVSVTIRDQTLTVPLGGVLPAGATARVQIAYRATLRRGLSGSDWMFSRAGGTLTFYRWIPWISRAVPFDRPNHGDPFVTASSPEVSVELLTDQPMILAAPAAEVSQVAAGPGRAWTFTIENVRDVSIVLAPDFEVSEGEAGGVAVRAYSRPGGISGDRLLDQAVHAITSEAARLGRTKRLK